MVGEESQTDDSAPQLADGCSEDLPTVFNDPVISLHFISAEADESDGVINRLPLDLRIVAHFLGNPAVPRCLKERERERERERGARERE